MDCLNVNCNVTGNDRMISCWLCLGNYHLKCSGLKPRDADSLSDPAKSLQWTCSRCKLIKIDFYKFFKSYNEEFNKLNREFTTVQNNLLKFGELFTKFQNLDKFIELQDNSSPKRKKTNKKSPVLPVISYSSVTANNDFSSLPTTSMNIVSPLETNAADEISMQVPLNRIPSPGISQINVNTNINTENNLVPHNPLRAIPPKKTIFISRLASETTSDDVDYYIKSKIGQNADVLIHKFQFSEPRSISSFKITVPTGISNHLLDINFWPENTLVREYIYKDRPRVNNVGVLPQRDQIVPKN